MTCKVRLGELIRVIFHYADIEPDVVRWVALILDFKVLTLELLNGVVDV